MSLIACEECQAPCDASDLLTVLTAFAANYSLIIGLQRYTFL